MKAALFKSKDLPLTVGEIKRPRPIRDEVLVKVSYAALNHRDLWLMREQTQQFPDGVVLGSDGSGVVEEVGEDADPTLPGAEVIINPSINWGNNPMVQGDTYEILDFPRNGTFAEYICLSQKYIFDKPEHLSLEEAAAVPLSALTAYRALFSKARLRANEKVLITGIGGGVALWLLQFAVSYQAQVYVTSSSQQKIQKAIEMGAKDGFNYKDKEWASKAHKEVRGFDVIIDGAAGDQFNALLELAVPGGRIVNYGRTAGSLTNVSMRSIYWKQLSIYGTTMGTRDEFLSMLVLLESRNIKPIVDQTFDLFQVNEAFDRMQSQEQFGKILLKIR
jgi:NADPH:quinone reductase-like Zn-dependent oxidoreductase